MNTMGASLLNQLMLLISGSLSARLLGPADRGHAALIALVPSILGIAGSFGLVSAVVYFVAQRPEATVSVLGLMKRELALQLLLLLGLHVAITILWLAPSLHGSDRVAAFVALGAVPATYFSQYGSAVLQGHQQFLGFTSIVVAPQVLYGIGVVALFVIGNGSLSLVVLANVLASVLTGLLALVLARRTVRSNRQELTTHSKRDIMVFARKSYFGQVAPIEAFRLDQVAVGAAFTPTVLGYYSVATAFTNLSRFLGSSMGWVLEPYIASLPAHQQRRSLIRGLALTLGLCGAVTLVLLPSTSFLVPALFGDAFRPAIPLARVLLVAGFLLGLRRAVLPGLQGIGQPAIGSYSELIALIVFAALLPLALTNSTGMGVAVVFLVSAIVALTSIAVLFRLRVGVSTPAEEPESYKVP